MKNCGRTQLAASVSLHPMRQHSKCWQYSGGSPGGGLASEFLPPVALRSCQVLLSVTQSPLSPHMWHSRSLHALETGISVPASLCSLIMDVLIYPSYSVQCQQLTRAPCAKSGTRASPIHWAPWIFSSASHWRDQTCGVFIHPLLPLTCRNKFTSKMQYAWLNGGQQRWQEACTD